MPSSKQEANFFLHGSVAISRPTSCSHSLRESLNNCIYLAVWSIQLRWWSTWAGVMTRSRNPVPEYRVWSGLGTAGLGTRQGATEDAGR